MVDPIFTMAATSIATALAKRVSGEDTSTALFGGLSAFAKSGGNAAGVEVEKWFKSKGRSEVLAAVVSNAVATAYQAEPDALETCGEFPSKFFEVEAAAELAKAFIVGEEAGAFGLAVLWAETDRSSDALTRAKYMEPTVRLCTAFLESYVAGVRSNEIFAAKTDRVAAHETASSAAQIASAMGAAAATATHRHEYLVEVLKRTRRLDTTGLGEVAEGGDLEIDAVYLPLRVLPQPRWRDHDPGDFDRALQQLITEGHAPEEAADLALTTWRNDSESAASAIGVNGALVDHSRLMLLGDPGSGKSTILQAHARSLAQAALTDLGAPVPIQLKAGDVIKAAQWSQGAFLDFLVQQHRAASYPGEDALRDLFAGLFDAGKAVVLFDACDEIPDLADRKVVMDRLADFVSRYDRNRFVASSRESGYYLAPLEGFDHFRVASLDPDTEIGPFAQKYWRSWSADGTVDAELVEERVDQITQALQRPGFARVASNPLVLTIMLGVQRRGGQLPHNRAEAYHQAADHLERRRTVTDLNQLRGLLVALATWTHRHRETGVVSIGDIATALRAASIGDGRAVGATFDAGYLDELTAEIRDIVSSKGPLIEAAPERWKFLHQTFQEFYVARGLQKANLIDTARALRYRLHDDRYREPILLTLGLTHHVNANPNVPSEDLVEAVIYGTGPLADDDTPFGPTDFEDLLHRDRDFAVLAAADLLPVPVDRILSTRVLGISPGLLPGVSGTELGQQLDEVLSEIGSDSDNDDSVRGQAAEALGWLGGELAVEALSEIACDSDNNDLLRGRAAWALGWLGGELAVEVVSEIASDRDNADFVRGQAVEALAKLGGGLAVGVLSEIARDRDNDDSVRGQAAEALGRLGETELAVRVRSEIARDRGNTDFVREQAAAALGRLGETELAVELLSGIARDRGNNGSVRGLAAAALGRLGETELAVELLSEIARDRGNNGSVRGQAARALGDLAGEPAVELLSEIARDRGNTDSVRRQAARALGDLAGEPAVELLSGIARDRGNNDSVRGLAAAALGRLGETELAVAVWSGIARDSDNNDSVRGQAAEALGRLGETESAVEVLLKIASDSDKADSVRAQAGAALGRLGETELAVEVLLEIASDGDKADSVRGRAARALGQLGQLRPPYPYPESE